MAYRVLIIGKPVTLPERDEFEVDFQTVEGEYSAYDLVVKLDSGKLVLVLTEEEIEFREEKLQELILKGIEKLRKNELDKNLALEMLGGSERLYFRSLKLYFEEYHDLKAKLEKYLAKQEYQAMRDLVHKVRGFTLYTGAKLLYKIAGILETELLEGEVKNLNHFLRLHERLLAYCQVENV
ncbi:MAG TPA: Hpt domain-containing protein [Acholeplasmataceae bacterium]|nr:Hpt domain-containing protein [Acholeplasmataceae bacterium]